MRYRYVFLDWDGTVFDSFELIYRSIANIFKSFGLKAPAEEIYRREIGKGIKEFYFNNGFDKIGDEFKETFKKIQELWVRNDYGSCQLFQGARETIEFLKNSRFTVIIISSNTHDNIRSVVENLNLPIDKIYTGDKKINFKLATDEFNIRNPGKIIFVDDLANNLEIAKANGATAIGATYGVDFAENVKSVADYTIENISDLITLVKNIK